MIVKRSSLLAFCLTIILSFIVIGTTGNALEAITFMCFFTLMIFYMSDARENAFIILFMMAFFVFLLGRPFAEIFLEITRPTGYNAPLTSEAENHMYLILTLGLLSLALGYSGIFKLSNRSISIGKRDIYPNNAARLIRANSIEMCTKPFVFVFYACVLAINVERAIYVSIFGYLESYLNRTSVIPEFVAQLADLAPIAMALYLSTLPDKKSSQLPIIVYLISNLSNLFTGARYEAVSAILIIILYALFRNRIDEEKWISKRMLVSIALSIPIAMVFLLAMEKWRAGGNAAGTLGEMLGEFFQSVGGSSSIIGYEYMYQDELLARGVWFSFGNVWRSLNNNAIGKLLWGNTVYQSQTVENALYGHSLGSFLMYKLAPARYLRGGGMGSCYLAELYCDFSYFGVIVGNLGIGAAIRYFDYLHHDKVFKNFFAVFLSMSLFRIPRDCFDYFLNQLIGIKNILFILLILFVSAVYRKRINE